MNDFVVIYISIGLLMMVYGLKGEPEIPQAENPLHTVLSLLAMAILTAIIWPMIIVFRTIEWFQQHRG